VEKLAHVHEWIRIVLQLFHQKFNSRMMVKKMLELGGKEWKDLPHLEGYGDKDNKNTMCYNHVLGYCSGNKCRFKHPLKKEITSNFAKAVCTVVEDGAKWLVLNETPAPGGNKDRGVKCDDPPGNAGGSPAKKGKGGGKDG
jgi:hypothetical protein